MTATVTTLLPTRPGRFAFLTVAELRADIAAHGLPKLASRMLVRPREDDHVQVTIFAPIDNIKGRCTDGAMLLTDWLTAHQKGT